MTKARGLLRLALVLGAAILAGSAAAGPFRTGIFEPRLLPDPARRDQALDMSRAAGASIIRVAVDWRTVAPAARPRSFEPANPADPRYRWGHIDAQVSGATERGLTPILTVLSAPDWAEGAGAGPEGTVRPDPVELGHFAKALATRYNGAFGGLPRVRYFQAWNEPNRNYFLMPQYEGGRLVSPGRYRAMVNRFADAVHAVHPNNLVIAGGLAPLGKPGKPAPLAFMRSLFSAPVKFDVWAHHPYTSGGPTHEAARPDDVSLGDLSEMRALLRSAVRRGRVVSSNRSIGFWVTEFSWDTNPPDPKALGLSLHSRWVSEALYRMWQNGVAVVVWYRIQDDPLRDSPFQSGLFDHAGRAKRSLTAFRFPVVAFRRTNGIYVWGRTPPGTAGPVVIELKSGGSWRRLSTPRLDASGIFSRTYRTPIRRGYVRARVAATASLPFSLTPVRDRFVNPFGCGGGIPC